MDRNALMTLLHKRFRLVAAAHDAAKNVTRLEISNNGHVSVDVTLGALEKLDAGELEQILASLEKVLACEP